MNCFPLANVGPSIMFDYDHAYGYEIALGGLLLSASIVLAGWGFIRLCRCGCTVRLAYLFALAVVVYCCACGVLSESGHRKYFEQSKRDKEFMDRRRDPERLKVIEQIKGMNGTVFERVIGGRLMVSVNFAYTRLTDSDLNRLTGLADDLEWLGLSGTQITDLGLIEIASLQRLRNLDLRDTKVTLAGIAELQRSLPECKITHNASK